MRWRVVVASACLVAVVAGCGSAKSGGQPGGSGVPTTAPAPAPAEKALPLWGPPGTELVDDRGISMSYTYAPLKLQDRTIQPLRTPFGIIYLEQQGAAVYLAGVQTGRGGFAAPPEPQLLYSLPLKAGDAWTITFPGQTGDTFTYHVDRTETVKTPAGDQTAVVVKGDTQSEWWVPGYGLVRFERSNETWAATKANQGAAQESPDVGQAKPGLKALLWDEDKLFRVTDLEGNVLWRVNDNYWRSGYTWKRAGDFDLLAHSEVPGSWGIVLYEALQYKESGFQKVHWDPTGGEPTSVSGNGEWTGPGEFRLRNFIGYPVRTYVYRFDGTMMKADPAKTEEEYAQSAKELAERLIGTPPIGQKDFVGLFPDAKAGMAAWDKLYQAKWQPFGTGSVSEESPGTFLIKDGVQFRVKIEQIDGKFRITSFAMAQ